MLAKEVAKWSKSSCRRLADSGRGEGRVLAYLTKPGSRWLPRGRVSRRPQKMPRLGKEGMAPAKSPVHPASGASPVQTPVPRVVLVGPSALQPVATQPNPTCRPSTPTNATCHTLTPHMVKPFISKALPNRRTKWPHQHPHAHRLASAPPKRAHPKWSGRCTPEQTSLRDQRLPRSTMLSRGTDSSSLQKLSP